jgi:L-ascorbate metabolism protein UlaG (beta-lactamase superfamily)
LSGLAGSNAVIVAPPAVYELVPSPLRSRTTVLTNGAATLVMGVAVEAVPMYNTGSSPAHPRGQGNGYVLTMGGRRIYIAGDSSDTPEMRALTGLDVAFINIYDPLTTPL